MATSYRGMQNQRRLELNLTTTGRFRDVTSRGLEPGDRFVLAEDRKTLRVQVNLDAVWHRSPKHVWVQDRDKLRFQVDPPHAPTTVTALLDGQPAATSHLRFPAVERQRWPVTLSANELVDNDRLMDRRRPGIYLYVRRRPEPQAVAHVSREINEALRVLGYIQ